MTTPTADHRLGHDRYCSEIIAQTDQLRELLARTELSAQVPTCPEWTMADLLRHVGGAHRWAETIVRTRATEVVRGDQVPNGIGPEERDALDAWLAEGATLLTETLREAGPETRAWTWTPEGTAGFWARRMTHETLVHRADAASADGDSFTADAAVAADAIDEWLEILSGPAGAHVSPKLGALGHPGQSLHLHATDADGAEWLIELGEGGFTWSRSHAKATVAVRGTVADLLRVFYRRLPADSERVEVLGDAALLEHWLEHASFE
ncbi:maleylpyruvate isomerase N-terminal domain-containing protein [Streptomyces palmae]|uniref:Maleylpyruvate isomerase family mycothiol-dependent enzyme n=1 Tax=Streptomyces palmae TaxID=1701085 RepID=A0A4Z0GGW9_9ACTN|nr:maleylpyruvate isomerase N-terminal domain-containing protein [Streptomyces palmae]TGA95572.1 maleylpyruvate isomerase family mycothiol-dependent enzyme [Streptomyces palmae]